MSEISEAVILLAGSGSRLRSSNQTLPKPLTPILGRPLISYIIEPLAAAGISDVRVLQQEPVFGVLQLVAEQG